MIDALLSGRLRGAVTPRNMGTSKPSAVWRMATIDKNGDSLLCSCIAFSWTAVESALRLIDGDSIAVGGEAAVNTRQSGDGAPRLGLDLLVHGVLIAYHLGRKRKGSDPGQEEL